MAKVPERLPSLYLETTIISYLAARPSQDYLILGHQEVTRQWWDGCRAQYRVFVAPLVLQEAARGDPEAASSRLELVRDIPVLDENPEIGELAERIRRILLLPGKATADAVHLAFAIWYEMDYLLTWNCAHLANARYLRSLADHARSEGLWLPVICTPDEMPKE
jgi:predicted nucleic acid-binding protein